MRALAPFLAILLAGCVEVPESLSPGAEALVPYHAEATVFLPPSNGMDRVATLVPFPVNATGATILARVTLGARYGSADAPVSLSDVQVELRDPADEVLDSGGKSPGSTATIEFGLAAETTGEHVLAILSYAGSDGQAYGEYAAYGVDVTYGHAPEA